LTNASEGAGEVGRVEDRRQVDDGAREVCHGDPAPLRSVPRIDAAAAVHNDSFGSSVAGRQNFWQ
jgi:hypothetical protein